MPGGEAKFFVSYAREDAQVVLKLVEKLQGAGANLWVDERGLRGGDLWDDVVQEEIDACEGILVFLSPDSVASRHVRNEVAYALDKGKRAVPVLIRECRVPIDLHRLHRIDIVAAGEDTGLARVSEALIKHVPEAAWAEEVRPPREAKLPKPSIKWQRSAFWLAPFLLVGLAVIGFLTAQRVPEMVKIPAGEFWMGCNDKVQGDDCEEDSKPGRSVFVDAFSIDRTEVTVAEYRKCVDAKKCTDSGLNMPWEGEGTPARADDCNWGKSGRDTHPINCVDWSQANSYCKWAGKRLPTEAEWEKAARGTEGLWYPWGNEEFDFDHPQGNFHSNGMMPVGSFPASKAYGLQDMAGNVWEWVADEIDRKRMLRGGSWYDHPVKADASLRRANPPDFRLDYVGFRCAR